jgi:MFS superfamily sulfate permease-like transporter
MQLLPHFQKNSLRYDLSSGFVVFLVALPLCLGIAVASDAPPLSGLITGILGGIIVSCLSGSELGVSGPAAGLVVTVIAVQEKLGGLEGLFVAIALSGILQIALGTIRAGLLATFFPSSVIKGMLAGIGIIIAFKQFPHAIGWRGEFNPEDGLFCFLSHFCLHGLYSSLWEPHANVSITAIIISTVSVALLVVWDRLKQGNQSKWLGVIPGPLVVVAFGIGFNFLISVVVPSMALTGAKGQLVQIPALGGLSELLSQGPQNVFSWLGKPAVWLAAATIALIGSVETLLCLEATDKLDPLKRISRPNRELVAQGIGNITAGLLGGLPMTSVIVRSSANVYAGAKSRLSGVLHGVFLLSSLLLIPSLLNLIPLASLAAILILIGYKLAAAKVIKRVWDDGYDQFLPFIVTIAGVVLLDLLSGVLIGTCFGLCVVLVMNHHSAFNAVRDGNYFFIRFAKDVTFLQKIALKRTLAQLPNDAQVVIDGGGAMFIDHDILELIEDFKKSAVTRGIKVELRSFPSVRFDIISAFSSRRKHGLI